MNNKCFPYHEQMYLNASFLLWKLKKNCEKLAKPKKSKLEKIKHFFYYDSSDSVFGPIKSEIISYIEGH